MYNVTDSSYTARVLNAGEALPSPADKLNTIHNIFQKMQKKQFNLPADQRQALVQEQAKLKKEALDAYVDDRNHSPRIMKAIIFILHLFNLKTDLDKKAEAILYDTGKLSTDAHKLGCAHDANENVRQGYVHGLTEAWKNRPVDSGVYLQLPKPLQDAYANPYGSLEEFILQLRLASKEEKMEARKILLPLLSQPFDRFLNHSVGTILPHEKAAFELGLFNIDKDVGEQIKNLDAQGLKDLLLKFPEDKGHPLLLEVLKEYSLRLAPPAGSPQLLTVDPVLDLKDESEKNKAALLLKNIYPKLKKDEFPIKLIERLQLTDNPHIKALKVAAIEKRDGDMINGLKNVAITKQVILKALIKTGNANDIQLGLGHVRDDDEIDYLHLLDLHLQNKPDRTVVRNLFAHLTDEEKKEYIHRIPAHCLNVDMIDNQAVVHRDIAVKLLGRKDLTSEQMDVVHHCLIHADDDDRKVIFRKILAGPSNFRFTDIKNDAVKSTLLSFKDDILKQDNFKSGLEGKNPRYANLIAATNSLKDLCSLYKVKGPINLIIQLSIDSRRNALKRLIDNKTIDGKLIKTHFDRFPKSVQETIKKDDDLKKFLE